MKPISLFLAAFLTASSVRTTYAITVYWDSNGATLGAGGAAPTGIWGTDAFWSTDSAGGVATAAWTSGDTAVFAAGTDAIGAYTVTVNGTQTAGGLTIEEGSVSFATGTVSVGAGAIVVGAGATLSTDSNARIVTTAGSTVTLDGGTLRTTNTGTAGTFFDTDSQIILGAAGGTFAYSVTNVLNIVQTATKITGTGSLTKTGPGVLAIASTAGNNTYSGGTIINDGELRMRTVVNTLPVTTAVTVTSPGIFNLNGVSTQIGSLTGNGNVGTDAGTLTISGATSTTFDGALKNIANAGAAGVTTGNGRLIKDGAGVITFNGLNDINGSVTLIAGGIIVTAGASLCGPIADVTVNGGTLTLNNSAQSIENLAGTGGTIKLDGLNHILTSDPIGSTTYAGTIAGIGGITRLNASATKRTLTLTGPNTYDGPTLVSAGIIAVGSATALGSTVGATEVANGAEILFTGVAANFTVNEAFKIAGAGATDGGAISVISSAAPTISGPITLSGDTTITVSGSASATFSNPAAFTSLSNQNLTLTGGANASGTKLVSGVIALGTGKLTKAQGGTWILTAANTYSGITDIQAGILQLGTGLAGADGTIANSTGVSIATGASLNFNRFGNDSFSGSISGLGSVTKAGPGVQTLAGTNTYSGSTNITGGTLLLGSATGLSSAANVTLSTGTLKTGGYSGTTTGSLSLNGNSVIDFIDATSVLAFNSNVTGSWSGILSIWNWDGSVWASGGTEKLIFTSSTLTAPQLASIQFYSDGGDTKIGTGADFLSGAGNGELIPVPEPSALLGGLFLGVAIGYRERRKRAAFTREA